jgi:hypothetical protein
MSPEFALEFNDECHDLPAKVFESVMDAMEFTHMLTCLEVSYRVELWTPPKRLGIPSQTIVMLLETDHGVRH